MKIIEAAEVRERLDMVTCMELMKDAFTALENGTAMQPLRTAMNQLPHGNMIGFMPAYLGDDDHFGVKVLTTFPENPAAGKSVHTGYVMLFESKTGTPVGMADSGIITEIRTGAVSGIATDLLARPDSKKLAIIGAGAQGRSHLRAMLLVRPSIESVSVYDIYPAAAERFKVWAEKEYGIPVNICKNAAEAVNDADIICTVTPSKKPFLEKNWVKKGAHINAVGTFSARTREVTSDLAKAARFYCDDRTALMKESGDFLIPIFEGKFGEDHLVGSIGEVLLGKVPGRQSEEEITLFDGLGLAVEDVICCRYLICGR